MILGVARPEDLVLSKASPHVSLMLGVLGTLLRGGGAILYAYASYWDRRGYTVLAYPFSPCECMFVKMMSD